MANMVASLDGAVTLDGRSGGLSSPLDKEIFAALRSIADVIMVGAGTARTERYGPVRLRPDHAERRRTRGQTATPSLVVVSRSGVLGGDLPLLDPAVTDPTLRPVVLTCAAGAAAAEQLEDRAEVWVCGEDEVDLGSALDQLAERGVRTVLTEGGPALNASMLASGLLDELCLTVAPLLTGGPAGRIVAGDGEGLPLGTEVIQLCEADGWLFGRWAVSRP
jgi:riboflavin biosynthesis pyrimidine reductase